jgi:predicted HAD superfamily Cof-like phosphohydrolase
MFNDVKQFHLDILGVEEAPGLTMISDMWIMERFRFLAEETNEFLEGAIAGNMIKTIDGLLDTVYVALGTLYMMGLPEHTVQACWDAIQKANMAKVRGMTARGNKIDAIKPLGWIGPEESIAVALAQYLDGKNV